MGELVPIKLMSYNVQGLSSVLLPIANLSARIDHVANYVYNLVEKYKVDVLILQEMFSSALYQRVKQALSGVMRDTGIINGVTCASPLYKFIDTLLRALNFISSGIIIFSRHPILRVERLVFSSGIFPDSLSGKGAVVARIDVNGRLVDAIGTHLQAYDGESAHVTRKLQIEELQQWINNNPDIGTVEGIDIGTSKRVPIVLAGDLNCSVIQDPSLFEEMVQPLQRKLENTFGDGDPEPTFSTSNDFCKYQNDPNAYEHIYDYIFKDRSTVLIEKQSVVKDKLEEPFVVQKNAMRSDPSGVTPMYNVSDHLPIVSVIGI
ncbi:Sphingomyelinase C [Babesia sp. Xinjiang]|uniref:Sphingomyelinase C n=1 Tax=Babesia sp. Xinjiang TaxID=462227 RepID=UPI000A23F4DA|nr:Sphingomyelinase C [Babesia sp. Xinjiang]ORM40547.1 Sphingomyelinase C [Babesia sp. Xinjiang]